MQRAKGEDCHHQTMTAAFHKCAMLNAWRWVMIKNPLQNVEEIEAFALLVLGIILLATLEPVSLTQIFSATLLAALVLVLAALDLWHWRHQ